MATTPVTPPPSSTAPPSPGLKQNFGNQAGNNQNNMPPGVNTPPNGPQNNNDGSALQKLNDQLLKTNWEKAQRRRVEAVQERRSKKWIGSGDCWYITQHGEWQSFTPSSDPKKLQKQIIDAIYAQMAAGNDKIYFYKGNKKDIHPQITKMATKVLAALQEKGGALYGCGLTISQDPMKTLEPFRQSKLDIFGLEERAKARELAKAGKEQVKSIKETNKLVM